MQRLETSIVESLAATLPSRQELVAEATLSYFDSLPADRCPTEDDFEVAARKADLVMRDGVLSQRCVAAATNADSTADGHSEALALAIEPIAPPLKIPTPCMSWQLRASKVAVAALVGTVVGMLILTPLLRLALGLEETVGMVLGGPLGAFCMVWVVRRTSQIPWLRKTLQAGMAAAAVADTTIAVVRGKGAWGVVKRVCAYIATAFVLRYITAEPTYDRAAHKKAVEHALEQWSHEAVVLLICLSPGCLAKAKLKADPEAVIRRLAKHFYALHGCSPEQLPVAVSELLQEARNTGFEGLDGEPLFGSATAPPAESTGASADSGTPTLWTTRMSLEYETYGHITEGDPVTVERLPIVLNGEILEKGMVRKVRRR